MRSLPWNRSAIIADVRDRIWTYVSTAADYAPRGMLVAAALLKWPESDALHLGELQYLLSDEVGDFISSLPNLVRRLATASAREENWTTERLQGPIHWNRTLSLRAATGMSSLFITAPAHRVYQTAENELLVHVLDSICRAGQSAGWDRDDRAIRRRPVAEVHRRLSEATRWQKSRMFTAVDRVPPTSRSLARVRSGRNAQRYAPVLAAYSKLHSLIEQLDRQAIREAIEQAGLVTADEATLFELFTTFQLIKALQSHGWNLRPFSLFSGHVTTRGSHEDGRHVQLWYQHTPRELAVASQYRQVLASHTFAHRHDLRPDIVVKWTDQSCVTRWLLIECKLSQAAGVAHAARQALADLLSYRRAFDFALSGSGHPYGLGVAWGAGLHPVSSGDVALCTPDTLTEAVSEIIC